MPPGSIWQHFHHNHHSVCCCRTLWAVLLQIVFFLMGLCYGGSTFMTAAAVYMSAYKEVPQGQCKLLVKLCAWVSVGLLVQRFLLEPGWRPACP